MSNKRQQIVDAIETRMKTILTTGGYETNAGQHVFVWRTTPLEDADLPALLIFDRDDGFNDEFSDMENDCFDLVVDVHVNAKGSTARTIPRAAIADVRRACRVDRTWGGLAIQTTLEKSDLAMEQAEKLDAESAITMRIVYTE